MQHQVQNHNPVQHQYKWLIQCMSPNSLFAIILDPREMHMVHKVFIASQEVGTRRHRLESELSLGYDLDSRPNEEQYLNLIAPKSYDLILQK